MKDKFTSIFFAGLLIILAGLNILTPEKTFSNKENRYLQSFPEITRQNILSGKFGDDFNNYSSDQFLGRNTWISLKTISDLALLKKDNGRVYFGKENYLFDVDEAIDKEQYNKNIKNINIFLDELKEKHEEVDIFALLVPSKSQVLKNLLPSYGPIVDEREIINNLNTSLRDNIDILSLIDIFSEKSDEYIYYRTDHHWTSKGAFYAYRYFLETNKEEALLDKDFIIKKVSEDFFGTSYRKANFYLGEADDINIYIPKEEVKYDIIINQQEKVSSLYDESYLEKTDKYSYFLGGDKSIVEIKTSVKNNKTILILKDSFANSFIAFLGNHYENIILIDPRYYNGNLIDYMNDKKIDQLLFLFNIQTFVQEKAFYKFSL